MKVSCPVCRKMVPWKGNPWRPFCSERCRMIDLASWASEEYRIPGEKVEEKEEEEEAGEGGKPAQPEEEDG
ncbi:MAG: DNA gyrase inhibitor YacG [Nitrospiraceae bacterium]|nr:DNA gyrase inhibitor YacG [Nitrospiraceae bacterium]